MSVDTAGIELTPPRAVEATELMYICCIQGIVFGESIKWLLEYLKDALRDSWKIFG